MGARSLLEKYIYRNVNNKTTRMMAKQQGPSPVIAPYVRMGGWGAEPILYLGGGAPHTCMLMEFLPQHQKALNCLPCLKTHSELFGAEPRQDYSVFFCVLLITCLRRLQAILPNLLLDHSSKSTSCLACPQCVCTSSRLAVHRCRPSNAGLGLLVLPFL